ncbi:MAG: NADH-quinone oxidoreductase subunit J, partial [Opitutales bacterium]|nr:NADH-quinone oxidoreductase subunit J [Opitutales bacterium]
MLDLLFYIFATLTLVPAFLMVTSRSPVSAAMYMIASFVGMACLFVMLEAFFLAILQVLVYAGAIMVLFL